VESQLALPSDERGCSPERTSRPRPSLSTVLQFKHLAALFNPFYALAPSPFRASIASCFSLFSTSIPPSGSLWRDLFRLLDLCAQDGPLSTCLAGHSSLCIWETPPGRPSPTSRVYPSDFQNRTMPEIWTEVASAMHASLIHLIAVFYLWFFLWWC